MDSISISNFRKYEQQALKQSELFSKELAYKKALNFTYPVKNLSEEPVPEQTNLLDEPVPQEGQKLNYLA